MGTLQLLQVQSEMFQRPKPRKTKLPFPLPRPPTPSPSFTSSGPTRRRAASAHLVLTRRCGSLEFPSIHFSSPFPRASASHTLLNSADWQTRETAPGTLFWVSWLLALPPAREMEGPPSRSPLGLAPIWPGQHLLLDTSWRLVEAKPSPDAHTVELKARKWLLCVRMEETAQERMDEDLGMWTSGIERS